MVERIPITDVRPLVEHGRYPEPVEAPLPHPQPEQGRTHQLEGSDQ